MHRIAKQSFTEDWELATANPQNRQAANEDHNCQRKQFSVIANRGQFDAEFA